MPDRLFAFLDPTFLLAYGCLIILSAPGSLSCFQIWNGTGAGKQENSAGEGEWWGIAWGAGRQRIQGGVSARCSLSHGGKREESREEGSGGCALDRRHWIEASPTKAASTSQLHSPTPYRASALLSHLPCPSSPRSWVGRWACVEVWVAWEAFFVACTLWVLLLPEVVR